MRILAIDDGYFQPSFKSRRGYTYLVGVLYVNARIELLLLDKILIDGLEATGRVIDFLKICSKPEVLMLDGVTYAGFDVVDVDKVYNETGVPVVVIQQYPLNLARVKKALETNFSDCNYRYEVIRRNAVRMKPYVTRWKTILVATLGLSREQTTRVLEETMIYSPVPEPLRIAHQIASTISRKQIERLTLSGPAGI